MCALPLEQEIEYPTSDGQPMAETTLHRKVMSTLIGGLTACPEGERLRLVDTVSGEKLLWNEELVAARQAAEERAAAAEERSRALAEELARLRAKL